VFEILDAYFAGFAASRQAGESFGDFIHRTVPLPSEAP
jgi:hypothetical protein